MKVLLIDDDEQIVGSLRSYLAMNGCHVDVAVEQEAAAALMREQRYGVVVVDPYLTGALHSDGDDVLGEIASLQPRASVIVVTGYGTPELARTANRAKLSLLSKPQSVITLSELIFGALRAAS